MKRTYHILGNLASAAPKIALLVTILASFMIGGSTLALAEPDPTLQCQSAGRVWTPPLGWVPIEHWFWVYISGPRVDTGKPCGTSVIGGGQGNT